MPEKIKKNINITGGAAELDTAKKRSRPNTPSKVPIPPSKKASQDHGHSRVLFAKRVEMVEEVVGEVVEEESSDHNIWTAITTMVGSAAKAVKEKTNADGNDDHVDQDQDHGQHQEHNDHLEDKQDIRMSNDHCYFGQDQDHGQDQEHNDNFEDEQDIGPRMTHDHCYFRVGFKSSYETIILKIRLGHGEIGLQVMTMMSKEFRSQEFSDSTVILPVHQDSTRNITLIVTRKEQCVIIIGPLFVMIARRDSLMRIWECTRLREDA